MGKSSAKDMLVIGTW